MKELVMGNLATNIVTFEASRTLSELMLSNQAAEADVLIGSKFGASSLFSHQNRDTDRAMHLLA